MKYLSIIRASEKYRDMKPPPALGEAMGKLIEKNLKTGALIDTGGLGATRDGFRVRVAGGKLTTIDGPFTESKEVIGGWAVMKADSREEILRLTAEFMELHKMHWPEFEGECEVRPIEFLLSDAGGAK
ncbi:MAG: YciI family protein [Thermoleophilia bacterium]|nr:YciI family protein [Thermoleophilia bacterium]